MDIIEKIHFLANQEPTETQKRLDEAFERYERKFGNRNLTSVLETDEDLIEKLNKCVELNVEFDDLYVNLKRGDLI